MFVIDVEAKPHDVEILAAERAHELRPRVVLSSFHLIGPKVRIYRTTNPQDQNP